MCIGEQCTCWEYFYTSSFNYGYPRFDVTVDGDTTADIDIPLQVYTVSGKVTDIDGNPIAGVNLSTRWDNDNVGGQYISCSASATTAETGTYELYLVPATYRIQINAPPALYPPFEIKKLNIFGDATRNIVLSYDYTVLDEALDFLPPELELDLDVFDVLDQSETETYDVPVVAPRNEMQIIVNWGGSEMRVKLFKPDGSLYCEYPPDASPICEYQSDTPPIIITAVHSTPVTEKSASLFKLLA
jgi:hypothetical protein